MAPLAAPSDSRFGNVTSYDTPWAGWVSSGRDRGTIDILYSSCITIVLCCWVATHPNAASPKDRWYHSLRQKLSLALIGLVGPDFIFALAFGQLASARRSVKQFRAEPHLSGGIKWKYRHAFFVDMGGIFLKDDSDEFRNGFPITSEQLFYLVKHGHVEFPDLGKMGMDEGNTTDTLSRVITLWQMFWFCFTAIQRMSQGLPTTTLEMTAFTFSIMMLATSICWASKPATVKPHFHPTKDNRSLMEIRRMAKETTHPELYLDDWHRTPLDFVGTHRWPWQTTWCWGLRVFAPLYITPQDVKPKLWDHVRSDSYLAPEVEYIPFGALVLAGFCAMLLASWNYYLPTPTEVILWRVSIAVQVSVTLVGMVVYFFDWRAWRKAAGRRRYGRGPQQAPQGAAECDPVNGQADVVATEPKTADATATPTAGPDTPPPQPASVRASSTMELRSWIARASARLQPYRNTDPYQDPEEEIQLRMSVSVTAICIMYLLARIFMYVEDFVALREQPNGVYITVNRFVPFLGG